MKLMAESTVYSLAEFLTDKSQIVRKGDVPLYILYDKHSLGTISENTEHLTRINDALETGAIIAFSNIAAEEIDNIVNELGLNVPSYLPDDAVSKDKAVIQDFYAVAARFITSVSR